MRAGIVLVVFLVTFQAYAQVDDFEEDVLKKHPLDSNDLPMSMDSINDYSHKSYVSLFAGLSPVLADKET